MLTVDPKVRILRVLGEPAVLKPELPVAQESG
jgi:hypothetical protein